MKRNISIFFIIVLCTSVLLYGCQRDEKPDIIQDNTYISGQDHQYQFSNTWLFDDKINLSDKGYYFTVGTFLYFWDKQSMKTTPLCNKPDCNHNDKTCSANINAKDGNIYFYNDNIYYIQQEFDSSELTCNIVRCSSDGSAKDTLATVNDSKNNFMVVHRGYLYYSQTEYTVSDRSVGGKKEILGATTIYRLDLSNNSPKPEVFLEKSDFKVDGTPVVTKLSAYGNYLVIYADCTQLSEDEDGKSINAESCIFTTALDTRTVTNLSSIKYPKSNAAIDDVKYLDGKLLFPLLLQNREDVSYSREVYTMGFDGKDMKVVFTVPSNIEGGIYTDEKYIYLSALGFDSEGNTKEKVLYVYDHSFKLLNTAHIPLPDPFVDYANMLSSAGDLLVAYAITSEPDENGEPSDDQYLYLKYIEKADLLKKDVDLRWTTVFESGK